MARSNRHFYSIAELQALPEPEWQIHKLFPVASLVVIYGAPATSKTFLAIDLALCIATGTEWNNREVRQGPIVYVAAEGGPPIKKRVVAWMQTHGIETVSGAFLLLEGVQVHDPNEVEALIADLKAANIKPSLIVFDTLAKCFVGADENSTKDMGLFVDGIEKLRHATGATVMVIHHTNLSGARERGNTALRGGVDVMIAAEVNDDGRTITIRNDKQKDDEESKDIEFERVQVDIGRAASGETLTSCVLVPVNDTGKPRAKLERLADHLRDTLNVLADYPDGTATRAAWLHAVEDKLETRTLDEHAKRLLKGHWVERAGRGRYVVTEKGRAAIQPREAAPARTAASASNLQLVKTCKSPSSAASATHPVGVAGATKAAVRRRCGVRPE